MANLIRLKQIESGSALNTAASVGADFSASVTEIVSQSIETTFSASIVQIITNNVGAVLPEGVVSSSAQINLISASGYQELATDLEVSIVSSSISTSINILSQTYATTASLSTISSSVNIISQTYATTASLSTISSSLDARVDALEEFSTSLDLTYATDAEVYVSQSNINIDMGEW